MRARLHTTELSLADAATIFADLSEATRTELLRTGNDAWTALRAVKHLRDEGEAVTIWNGATPVALFGSLPIRPRVRTTWFFGANAFFNTGMAGVMFGRRFMREQQERHPGDVFESRSWSVHPDLVRWFELQGFRHVENDGTSHLFRYQGSRFSTRAAS